MNTPASEAPSPIHGFVRLGEFRRGPGTVGRKNTRGPQPIRLRRYKPTYDQTAEVVQELPHKTTIQVSPYTTRGSQPQQGATPLAQSETIGHGGISTATTRRAHETLPTPRVGPLAAGASALVRHWCPIGTAPDIVHHCGQHHGNSVLMRLAFCPNWAEFWGMRLSCWADWSIYAKG